MHPASSSRLFRLGFSSYFENAFAPHRDFGLVPARVGLHHRGGYVLFTEEGETPAQLAGRLRHEASSSLELPAVGDWVAARPSADGTHWTIHFLVPRRTAFLRGVAGGATEAQIVAANVDVVLLVCALGQDLNPRRIERALTLARASGAESLLVLTKADLDDAPRRIADVHALAPDLPILAVCALTGEGVDDLRAQLSGDRTVALLGSSGAGKSTLVNRLAGVAQAVAPLGVDGRGQHTTTHRELVLLPGGGVLIDTPGMRGIRLWDADDGLDETFQDIASVAKGCHFRDCGHDAEPGCAIQAALDAGTLAPDRWASHLKLERELEALAVRKDVRAAASQKQLWKVRSRAMRARYRHER